MKPVMNKREDIEEIVNSATERTAKKIFDTVIDTGVGTGGKKLSEVLKDIKDKPPEQKNEGAHKHDDDIDCPACKTGHVHKLKNDESGTFKCMGNNCGKEYHLISTTPDFQCVNCGTPIDKPPKELEDKYSCPTCGKDHFKEFNKKLLKKIKT